MFELWFTNLLMISAPYEIDVPDAWIAPLRRVRPCPWDAWNRWRDL